jgi:hypothetical protein
MVVMVQEPLDRDQSIVEDNAFLITPIQPDSNVLGHQDTKTTYFVMCAMKHPQSVQVNVCGEITGTGDQ